MSPLPPPDRARRLALFAAVVCALAVAAAVLCFARGSLLGVVWVLMAGLTSNTAWYQLRRARTTRPPATPRSGA